MTNVAVVGASGYAARELIQILLRHPEVRIQMATSRQEGSPGIAELHPSLTGRIDLKTEHADPDRIAEKADVAFLGLPHGASMALVPELRSRGLKVIDLSADYRLKDPRTYKEWYQQPHQDPEGLAEAVYGLPEINREAIQEATLIANPGCYPSASILGLAPLIREGMLDLRDHLIIDAKSGVSGAGRSPKLNTHFPECNEGLSAYKVGEHRHTPEIAQILAGLDSERDSPLDLIFTPHLVPMDRGILATIYGIPAGATPLTTEGLLNLYRNFYQNEPFVRVVERLPSTKDSAFSNFCDISVRVVGRHVVVVSCLDNLFKGASGAAVQNMNLICNYPETMGLL